MTNLSRKSPHSGSRRRFLKTIGGIAAAAAIAANFRGFKLSDDWGAPSVFAFTSGQAADLVIGQSSFTTSTAATTTTGLNVAGSASFDSSGNLWATDLNNNRILRYSPPFSNGQAANLVIGQTDFITGTCNTGGISASTLCFPVNVIFDSSGNLWVGDQHNNRVLRFPKGTGFTNGQAADLVIGQSSFTTNGAAATATGLHFTGNIAFDSSGNLWVADFFNSRVLRYSPPFSSGQAADLVIGQTDLTTGTCNPGGISASTLCFAPSEAFDSSGNLWIVDHLNNRILRYSPPFSTGQAANLVIGQSSFTTNTGAGGPCGGTASPSTLCNPAGIAFDPFGNLLILDQKNNRVLRYSKGTGFTSGQAPDLVIGQSSFTTSTAATTATGLNFPGNIIFDSSGNLWVGDGNNNRFLEYAGPSSCVPPPSGLITWWPGDGNANDIVAGNNGILQNGAGFAGGRVAQAFAFDGLDDHVRVPHTPLLNPPGSFTIDAWISQPLIQVEPSS